MIENKIKKHHTYLVATNYWAPLNNNNDNKNESEEEEANVIKLAPTTAMPSNKQMDKMHGKTTRANIIIYSGATSHFISKELNLPSEGKSNKEVYLPDNTRLRTSTKTKLHFKQLTKAAREADILPGLKQLLLSVNKMAEEGYTTIFHPGEEGVTIHKEGTVTITTSKPQVLEGYKNNPAKLWMVSATQNTKNHEEAINVYSLPSIQQSIKYIHAAAKFPVKETWINAIKHGNFATWPGLTTMTIRKHFPDLDKTQQGHMKKQHQGVRSMRTKIDMNEEGTHQNKMPPKKMQNVYIQIHNASETIHTDQSGRFLAMSSKGNQYIMVLVEVDGNYINAEPMKNKSERLIINDYLALWTRLTASGTVRSTTHILDNEASARTKRKSKKMRNPISPAGQSSTKSGRTSNTNLQKQLQSSDSRGGQ